MTDKKFYFPYGAFYDPSNKFLSKDKSSYPVIIYVHCDMEPRDISSSSLEGVFISDIDLRGTLHNLVVERNQMSEFERRNQGTFVDLSRQNSPRSWAEIAGEINRQIHGGVNV